MEVNGILVAAHELKAPLCLMRQLAFALDATEDPGERHTLQRQMVKLSDRALSQVNDLTKIARLDDGLFELEPVSVRGVCESVFQEIRPLFQLERRQLDFTYSNKARLVIANRELLYSVVYNFCSNALHYSNQESASQLSVTDHQGTIRVNIRDYGPALPTQLWQTINHGELTKPVMTAMRPGSSGLGLYIAAQFAAHMHARLGATRHRDGTSFYVDLPVSKQAALWD